MNVTIHLDRGLAERIEAEAKRTGKHPHGLALEVLRERFPQPVPTPEEVDAMMARLHAAASDCGVSLPNEALTSEAIYE
ncbi:MAG TPA: hypothetical protein VD866_32980 [Urbifossiella sp.]|nr:hypothetical protein [Urbifossiella sp.]